MKAAGVIIQAPDGKVLFLKRGTGGDHPGEWCLPAGKADEGEDAETTARRECEEETGLKIDGELVLFDERDDFSTFLTHVPSQFVPKDQFSEHVGFAWAPPQDPPQPLHPGVQATFDGEEQDEGRFEYGPGDLEIFGPDGAPIDEGDLEEEEVDAPTSSMEVNIYEEPVA